MPVISSPTRSRYSSNIMSRSASRIRWRITCLAVCAAMRPKSCGVTSCVSIWSSNSASFSQSRSGSGAGRRSPVSGATWGSSASGQMSTSSSTSGGSSSSHTVKSPDSRSISTRAYVADSGVFLYADRSASSRATKSFSAEIPFSLARARVASRISLDTELLPYEVGTLDVVVRDGHDAAGIGDGDLRVGGADELSREALATVDRLARPDARAMTEEAAEVLRLGERALDARRRDLEGVVLPDLGQAGGDSLAKLERDAVGMIDVEPDQGAVDHLRQKHLDVGLVLREPAFDVLLDMASGVRHDLPPQTKKWASAHFRSDSPEHVAQALKAVARG